MPHPNNQNDERRPAASDETPKDDVSQPSAPPTGPTHPTFGEDVERLQVALNNDPNTIRNLQRSSQQRRQPSLIPDRNADDTDDIDPLDYITDIGKGTINGVVGFGESVANLPGDLLEGVTDVSDAALGTDFNYDYKGIDLGELDTKTWVGGLTSGVVQFGLGFVSGSAWLTRAGWVARAGSRSLQLSRGATAGAIADFVSFEGQEERLSDMLVKYPALRNPVTEYLEAEDDDSGAEGRFKNALEGLGLGVATDLLVSSVRGLRNARRATTEAEKRAVAQQTEEEMLAHLDGLTGRTAQQSDEAAEASTEAAARPAPAEGAAQTEAAETAAQSRNIEIDEDQAERFRGLLQQELDNPGTVDPDAIMRPLNLNLDKFVAEGDTETALTLARNFFSEQIDSLRGGSKKTFADMKQEALDRLGVSVAEDAGVSNEGIPGVVARMQARAKEADEMTADLLAAKGLLKAYSQELNQLARLRSTTSTATDEVIERYDKVNRAFVDLLGNTLAVQTGAARTTAAGRINIDFMLTGASKQEALNALDDSGFDEALRKRTADTLMAGGDPKKTSRITRSLNAFNEFRIANLLWSPKTHVVNFVSGSLKTAMLPAERIVGGMLSGNRKEFAAGMQTFAALGDSFMEAFQFAKQAYQADRNFLDPIKTQFDAPKNAISSRALGANSESTFGSFLDWWGKVHGMSMRMLMAEDEFLKQINFRAYAKVDAMQDAAAKGFQAGTQEYEDHVRTVFNASFKPDGRGGDGAALRYANKSTFTTELDGLAGTLGKAVADHPILRIVTPFYRVPLNIVKDVWDRTPVRPQLLSEAFGPNVDAATKSDAMGRLATGSAMYTTAAMLAAGGKITGQGPADPTLRKQWLDAGNRPYSFVFTDPDTGTKRYIQYNRLDPFGIFFGMVADFSDLQSEMDPTTEMNTATMALTAVANNLTNKTYLQGLSEALAAFTDPSGFEMDQWMRSFGGSLLPFSTALNELNQDPFLRESRSVLDELAARTPGFSDSLPPRRNILGEPVKAPAGWLPFNESSTAVELAANELSPFAFSKKLEEPVKDEIVRLKHRFSMPNSTLNGLDLREVQNDSGRQAYDRWLELQGSLRINGRNLAAALNRLIQSSRYQRLPDVDPSLATDFDFDNPRILEIRRVISRYRSAAKRRMIQEFPEVRQHVRERREVIRSQRFSKFNEIFSPATNNNN